MHFAIKPICSRCARDDATTFNAASLWFYFKRRGWDGTLRHACARFWCRRCGWQIGRRVRPSRLDLVRETDNDLFLAMVGQDEWRREISRWRG